MTDDIGHRRQVNLGCTHIRPEKAFDRPIRRVTIGGENEGYTKSISFLEGNFKNMTTFLRVPGVQRNSLAETGMRVLRRLESNHDGFCTEGTP
jgi:hypothetical protein